DPLRYARYTLSLHDALPIYGAGVSAQQQRQPLAVLHIDVERVLHGACGMIFGIVQRREIGPVVFDLRAISHIKTYGAENSLDPLDRKSTRLNSSHVKISYAV